MMQIQQFWKNLKTMSIIFEGGNTMLKHAVLCEYLALDGKGGIL
jgi:hypothetical protein